MKSTKTKFIKKYGSKVTVKNWAAGVFTEPKPTHALLGRGNRTNSNMKLLQTLREGIFPAEADIDSGYFVENVTQRETYIVGGTLLEYGINETLSIVANLLICNGLMTLKGQKKVADTRGNMKTEFVVTCADLPCSFTEVSNDLRVADAGILPETEYMVYSTLVDVIETDQLILTVNGKNESFKILSKDYVTFPNMVVLQASRDIRK
jgi:hypothetical protein